jgi:hypothetical protein
MAHNSTTAGHARLGARLREERGRYGSAPTPYAQAFSTTFSQLSLHVLEDVEAVRGLLQRQPVGDGAGAVSNAGDGVADPMPRWWTATCVC